MDRGWSEMVREVADRDYIQPALNNGGKARIVVGELKSKLRREKGFPSSHTNQICSALESDKFLGERLELHGGKGKPRLVSTVYEYSVKGGRDQTMRGRSDDDSLLELMGALRGAIQEGADAFVREIRRDKGVGE